MDGIGSGSGQFFLFDAENLTDTSTLLSGIGTGTARLSLEQIQGTYSISLARVDLTAVPEPATWLLLGSGLVVLAV